MSISTRIAKHERLGHSLISHHLKELRRVFLVKVERRGPFIFYTLADQKIPAVMKALSDLAETLLPEKQSF